MNQAINDPPDRFRYWYSRVNPGFFRFLLECFLIEWAGKIIAVGLVLFTVGSSVAALAENVYWLIIGRALQAVAQLLALCLASDLTRLSKEQNLWH